MLHRGGGRTTEPQYCRIRHPVRQKRKGARQDTSSVPSAGSQYIPPGLPPSSRTSHFTPLRFADRTTPIRRPGPKLHYPAGGERTPPPHPEYSRGAAESAPPHRGMSCDDSAVRWRTRNSNAAGMKAKTTDRIFLEPKLTARKYCRS